MSKLDNVSLRVTPFGRRVVLARMSAKDPRLALETKDVMSDFWHALVEFVGVGNEVQFGGGDEQFVVRLMKHEPEASSDDR